MAGGKKDNAEAGSIGEFKRDEDACSFILTADDDNNDHKNPEPASSKYMVWVLPAVLFILGVLHLSGIQAIINGTCDAVSPPKRYDLISIPIWMVIQGVIYLIAIIPVSLSLVKGGLTSYYNTNCILFLLCQGMTLIGTLILSREDPCSTYEYTIAVLGCGLNWMFVLLYSATSSMNVHLELMKSENSTHNRVKLLFPSGYKKFDNQTLYEFKVENRVTDKFIVVQPADKF